MGHSQSPVIDLTSGDDENGFDHGTAVRVPASGQIRRQTLGVEDRKAPFGEITQETRSRSRSSGELPSVLPQIRQTREEDERSRHGGTVLSHYRNESLHHINRSANASTEESEEGLEIGGQSGQNLNTPPRAHSAAAEAPNSTGGPDTSRKVDCMRFALVFQTQILPWIRSATVRHANGLSAAAQQQIGNWTTSQIVNNYLRETYKRHNYRLTVEDREKLQSRINTIVAKKVSEKHGNEKKAAEARRSRSRPEAVDGKAVSFHHPLSLVGSLKENVQVIRDLSLLGPGESNRKTLKRTADGRLKGKATAANTSGIRRQVQISPSKDIYKFIEQNEYGTPARSSRQNLSATDSRESNDRDAASYFTSGAVLGRAANGKAMLAKPSATTDVVTSDHESRDSVLELSSSKMFPPAKSLANPDLSRSQGSLRVERESRTKNIRATSSTPPKTDELPFRKGRFQSIQCSDSKIPKFSQTSQVHTLWQSKSSLIRCRELGSGGRRSWLNMRSVSDDLRVRSSDYLKPCRSWTGASNDIMVLAWAPDNLSYAIGASAQTDESSMQYNRPNNLLHGSLSEDTLWELPEHRIDRPRPAQGPNSNQATYDACDPNLYMSVTSVHYSGSGDRLFSASYDRTVKIWDASNQDGYRCLDTLVHDAEIEVMATSGYYDEHLATGSRQYDDAIRIYALTENASSAMDYFALSSGRAQRYQLYPSCLQWGTTSHTRHLLLAGFSPKDRDDSEDPGKEGDLCVWDLTKLERIKVFPDAQNVFDAVWHPSLPMFAVGSMPRIGNRTFKSTRSALRIYEPLRMSGSVIEYECPALDMNDVSFCPQNMNYVTAGCTNGVTYVWDFRMPLEPVHRLEHGYPITPMKPDMTREQSDMGVRLAAWGQSGSRFYTGSSDGVVKCWDIKLATEDVHIRDVAQFEAGVMCGAFSPDFTTLLLGDARGSVHVLSTAPIIPAGQNEIDSHDVPVIRFKRAVDSNNNSNNNNAQPDTHTARSSSSSSNNNNNNNDENHTAANAATSLLATKELTLHPLFGAGKGPNYKGPYAAYARPPSTDPTITPLLPEYQAQQLDTHQRSLAAQAGVSATLAELEFVTVQRALARARNLKIPRDVMEEKSLLSEENSHGIDLRQKSRLQQQQYSSDSKVSLRKSMLLRETSQQTESSDRHSEFKQYVAIDLSQSDSNSDNSSDTTFKVISLLG